MSKKKINCNVVNCKFNDDKEYLCCLDDIEISCTCNNEKCKNKRVEWSANVKTNNKS